VADVDLHGASRAQVVLAAFATDAIDLLTGPHRQDLRACGAPGCVLLFLKDHPRREWCSAACGNRARQARHYARTRGGPQTRE
jgi:predicted RNA-binding Zn ribbon-like protein